MKNITTYLLFFIIALLFNSCAISNEVHFNKNYSGTYAMNVDFGDMIDMLKSMDPSMAESTESDMIDNVMSQEERDEFVTMLNKQEGISNASVGLPGNSSIEVSFDFEDVEGLNSAFTEIQSTMMDDNEMMGGEMDGLPALQLPEFTRNGKEIVYASSMGELPLDDLAEGEEAAGMVDMVVSMMDYTMTFSFDRKIKSVDLDGVDLVSQDKKVLKTRMNIEEFMKGGSQRISVRVK